MRYNDVENDFQKDTEIKKSALCSRTKHSQEKKSGETTKYCCSAVRKLPGFSTEVYSRSFLVRMRWVRQRWVKTLKENLEKTNKISRIISEQIVETNT